MNLYMMTFMKYWYFRVLFDRAQYRPFEGRRRVVVIDQADALVPQAQNALLKTLEEQKVKEKEEREIIEAEKEEIAAQRSALSRRMSQMQSDPSGAAVI